MPGDAAAAPAFLSNRARDRATRWSTVSERAMAEKKRSEKRFDLSGQIDIAAFEAAPGLAGDWGKGRIAKPEPRQREFPLNLNIINFASPVGPK